MAGRVIGNYRGTSALKPEKVPIALASKGIGKGGTHGKGSRQGTQRTPSEQYAFDWDHEGTQRKALNCSFIVYSDSASRSTICSADGRHKCGLVLVRPRRPACDASTCLCRADTSTMADRIGTGTRKKVRRLRPPAHGTRARSSLSSALRVSRDEYCARAPLTQVQDWWSKKLIASGLGTELDRARKAWDAETAGGEGGSPRPAAAARSPAPRSPAPRSPGPGAGSGRARSPARRRESPLVAEREG